MARLDMALKDITLDQQIRRASLYSGLYSRVARRLGVDRSHVRRVAIGQRTSRRITGAIEREIARIEKELARGAA